MIKMVTLAPAAVLLATGCAGGTAEQEAATVAEAFQSAVQAEDLERACALLSPEAKSSLEDDCVSGLKEADIQEAVGAATTQVYGQNGMVRWRTETVFVSRFPGGWKVVAAGCTPRQDQPYDCSVSGG